MYTHSASIGLVKTVAELERTNQLTADAATLAPFLKDHLQLVDPDFLEFFADVYAALGN